METSEQSLEDRKNKIIKWVRNPYNATFILILILAIAIRIYYFALTYNQPLWWDEAEYMNIANRFAFGLEYEFTPVRPNANLFAIFIYSASSHHRG